MSTPSFPQGSLAAAAADSGFGSDHLPYGSYAPAGGAARLGVRIGDLVLDVAAATASETGAGLGPLALPAVQGSNLDAMLRADAGVWAEVRAHLRALVEADDSATTLAAFLTPVEAVTMSLPFTVADYVDFYGNEYHATNVGHIFRPEQAPLTANWKHLPIGYHGRAGTIIPTGTDFPRPKGVRPEADGAPTFGPCRTLDIEAEVGFVLGSPVVNGEVSIAEADEHVFGLVLVNDWSARDIQRFEYVPLGPNLGKSFATSISVWVTPLEALSAVRVAPPTRDVPLSGYLDDSDAEPWCFDLEIDIELNGERVSTAPFAATYWTAAQMLAHMTVNGAGLRAGDFFAGGTVSGPERDQRGSFLELCWGGREPLVLADGTEYTYLRDGDEIALRATARGAGGSLIRFGECVGTVLPST